MQLFNDSDGDADDPNNNTEPEEVIDPYAFALDLVLAQYPIPVIRDRFKQKGLPNADKYIKAATSALSLSLKEDSKFASEFYVSTLRLVIGMAIEAKQFNAVFTGLKEMRDFMGLRPNEVESVASLKVNFLEAKPQTNQKITKKTKELSYPENNGPNTENNIETTTTLID